MTKIKFRFHNKPVSDEQITSLQNFDALMVAFAETPKPSLQNRLIHNRFFIYTTGIMSGILITTIATLFILKTETTQLPQVQNIIQTQSSAEVFSGNNSEGNSSSVVTDQVNISSGENASKEKNANGNYVNEKKPSTVKNTFSENYSTPEDVIMNEGSVVMTPENSEKQNFVWQPSEEKTFGIEKTDTQDILQPQIVPYEDMEGNSAVLTYDSNAMKTFVWQVDSSLYSIDNSNQQLEDTSKKKFSGLTNEMENKVVELSKNITDESKTSYAWMSAKLNHIFASGNHEQKVKTRDTVSILNRPAQVLFLYPFGSNGISSGRYSNNFSLNILTGFNGGVNGCEIGGLVNVDRKNINGLQVGGLTNIAFGNLNGAQIGGLVNQSKSVNGAQVGGLVNTAIGSVK